MKFDKFIFSKIAREIQASNSSYATYEIFCCPPKIPSKYSKIQIFLLCWFFFASKEARKPSDMSELVKQTAEDNQALMIKLKDLQRK